MKRFILVNYLPTMLKHFTTACIILIAGFLPVVAQDSSFARNIRNDLEYFRTELSSKHKNPFTQISKQGFDSLVFQLKMQLPR